ncbi:MAG: HDOD domain-containing protein [Sedimentisphaerales bacterium]|nr:HDOD domain-containing protein [Sedimentisphaerales bacterium]
MLGNESQKSSDPNADKREKVSRKITQLVDNLPLFPTDINQLLTAAVKPSEDGIELLLLIESDSKLRSELLVLTRSYFGATGDFGTVEDAVRQIGVQPLVQLIGISYARDAIRQEFTALKYLNDYIDHGEDIYIASDILSGICSLPRERRQMHALAGLVHDVGRLAIMVADNKTSGRVLGTLWDRMVSVVHEEKAELGMDHCDVGARICRRWNFSPVIQEAVLRHHSPIMNGDLSFSGALIFLSHFVSASDPSGEILATLLATKVLSKLDLTLIDFEKARDQYKSRTQNSN